MCINIHKLGTSEIFVRKRPTLYIQYGSVMFLTKHFCQFFRLIRRNIQDRRRFQLTSFLKQKHRHPFFSGYGTFPR